MSSNEFHADQCRTILTDADCVDFCDFQLFGVSCAPLDLPIVRRLHASIETCPQQRPFDLPSFRCKPEREDKKKTLSENLKVLKSKEIVQYDPG